MTKHKTKQVVAALEQIRTDIQNIQRHKSALEAENKRPKDKVEFLRAALQNAHKKHIIYRPNQSQP